MGQSSSGLLNMLSSGNFSGLLDLFKSPEAAASSAPPARPDPAAAATQKDKAQQLALSGLQTLSAPAPEMAAPTLGAAPNRAASVAAPVYGTHGVDLQSLAQPIGMAKGGIAALARRSHAPASSLNDKAITSHAVMALKGRHPNPTVALAHYLRRYGTAPFRDLVDQVHSGTPMRQHGKIQGVGDGMSDHIPAQGPGGSDVMLADGEYVVPADVVSGLGNGSTDAGVKHLQRMGDRVRQARTGGKKQPGPLNSDKVLPA